MRLFTAAAFAAATLASACAQSPESIVGIPIPASTYAGLSCERVRTELAGVQAQLGPLLDAQRQARNDDNNTVAAGALFIGVFSAAVAAGTGAPDQAPAIAQLRGQEQALQAAVATCAAQGA